MRARLVALLLAVAPMIHVLSAPGLRTSASTLPAAQTWPSEPTGLRPLLSPPNYQYPYSIPNAVGPSNVGPGPLTVANNTQGASGAALMTQVTDATQPLPGFGLQSFFPNGYGPGAPASLDLTLGTSYQRTFSGLIVKFSSNWIEPPAGGKFIFHRTADLQTELILAHVTGSTTIMIEIVPTGLLGNNPIYAGSGASGPGTTETDLTPGLWWRIEFFTQFSTTLSSADGIVQVWVSAWNGSAWGAPVLQINLTNVQYPNTAGMGDLTRYPGVSGTSPVITQDQWEYDNVLYWSAA